MTREGKLSRLVLVGLMRLLSAAINWPEERRTRKLKAARKSARAAGKGYWRERDGGA
ncbi:MAG TPA: hypothetical protein VJT82_00755 [Pyrinomonadaceae bacterium]|nr:hypothetical protein [Pyrinomonadaceae bacterium]